MAGQWEYEESRGQWSRFCPPDNALLEASYAGSKAPVTLDFGKMFTVDFGAMQMKGADRKDPVRAVRRQGPAALKPEVLEFIDRICSGQTVLREGEHIMALFAGLGVAADQIDSFVVAFKAQSVGPTCFTKEEVTSLFRSEGMTTDAKKNQALVAGWVATLRSDLAEFSRFYKFIWQWNRSSASATVVMMQEISDLWTMTLNVRTEFNTPFAKELLTFMAPKAKSVSLDLWMNVLKFLTKVKPSLQGYDEDECYQTVIDDYVDFKRRGGR